MEFQQQDKGINQFRPRTPSATLIPTLFARAADKLNEKQLLIVPAATRTMFGIGEKTVFLLYVVKTESAFFQCTTEDCSPDVVTHHFLWNARGKSAMYSAILYFLGTLN